MPVFASLSATVMALAIGSGSVAAAPAADAASPAKLQFKGAVGVCIRWTDDPEHVTEAIVVWPSGNAELDAAAPATVRGMTWPRPSGPGYRGEWIGVVLQVGGAPPREGLPKCDALPAPASGNPADKSA
jgi:hypothetical protein